MSNLFIGLGGTGIEAVKEVFKKQYLVGMGRKPTEQYLLIDTDTPHWSIPDDLLHSFIDIGDISLYSIKEYALNSPYKEWFTAWFDYTVLPPKELNYMTLGLKRPLGRLCLLGHYDEIYQRLFDVICKLDNSLLEDEQLNVFVVSGSCGATGSAIALDILYLISTILKSSKIQHRDRCDNVCLMIALPDIWLDRKNPDSLLWYKYISNYVAFFTELEFAMNDDKTVSATYCPIVPPEKWMAGKPFSPFKHGYALETQGRTTEQVQRDMGDILCSLAENNVINSIDVLALTDRVLTERIDEIKSISDGRYSFVDRKFARKVLGFEN